MTDLDRLLHVAAAYCAATGLSEARVSTLFLKGGSRIASLRAGGDMGSRTIARAIEAFSDAWPADAVWPAEVPRPSREASVPVELFHRGFGKGAGDDSVGLRVKRSGAVASLVLSEVLANSVNQSCCDRVPLRETDVMDEVPQGDDGEKGDAEIVNGIGKVVGHEDLQGCAEQDEPAAVAAATPAPSRAPSDGSGAPTDAIGAVPPAAPVASLPLGDAA